MFFSKKNIKYLKKQIKKNVNKHDHKFVDKLIEDQMVNFWRNFHNIIYENGFPLNIHDKNYEPLFQSFDLPTTINRLNIMFINDKTNFFNNYPRSDYIQDAHYNQFFNEIYVDAPGMNEENMFSDLYQDECNVTPNVYRDFNNIPQYRRSLHARYYDRDIDETLATPYEWDYKLNRMDNTLLKNKMSCQKAFWYDL